MAPREEQRGGPGEPVPIDNDTEVLRRAIWLETDKQYKSAAEALIKIKTGKEVKVETAEGAAPDFTHEQPHTYIGPETSFQLERKPWEEKVRAYTKEFRYSPAVINSIVTFTAQAQNAYQITSEGTQLQYGQIRYRLELFIQGKAPDGMDLDRYYNFDWVNPVGCAGRQSGVCRGRDDAQGTGRIGRRSHQRAVRGTCAC